MADRVVHITVKIPRGCTADEVAQFALDALTSWGGQLHPEDPLFYSLQISAMRTTTKIYAIDEGGQDFKG